MKKKNGFTLVELLAIIIILGIIALITVPVILDIIDKSKEGAIKDSAYGYVDAVNKLYFSGSLHGRDGVSDGYYTVAQLKTMGVAVSVEPSEGWVELEDDLVVSYSLKFGDYVANLYSNSNTPVVEKNGNLLALPITVSTIVEALGAKEKEDGAYYITSDTGVEIYYDPVAASLCDTYVSSNSDKQVRNGCMKWYLYRINDGVASLLLDHNVTWNNWISENDWNNSATLGPSLGVSNMSDASTHISINGQNGKGPLTILKSLNYSTITAATWNTGIIGDFTSYTARTSHNLYYPDRPADYIIYSVDYSNYKARLLSAEEVMYVSDNSASDLSNRENIELPSWLCVNLSTNYSLGIPGYWTSTPGDHYYDALGVSAECKVVATTTEQYQYGVRPVITVPVADIIDQLS